MSMNRRGFFNMIPKGAAAVAVAGAVATEVVNEVAAKPVVEEVKKSLPPEKKTFGVMQAVNPEPKEVRAPVDRGPNAAFSTAGSYLSPGADGPYWDANVPSHVLDEFERANAAARIDSYVMHNTGARNLFVGSGVTTTLTPAMTTIETSVNIGGNGNQQVDFGVNDDGELWIRSKNGDWKKVVTE